MIVCTYMYHVRLVDDSSLEDVTLTRVYRVTWRQ